VGAPPAEMSSCASRCRSGHPSPTIRRSAGDDTPHPTSLGTGRHDGSVAPERPLIGHVDVDAFFAAVEQRDKPSLRGRPVVVGGTGPRGVVATASYEARRYGIHSAMPTAEARRRCPSAAVLAGRFEAYRESSEAVMAQLHHAAEVVEQVSLDEAYLALAPPLAATPADTAARLRAAIAGATGLTASVGVGPSKLVAKIASDAAKPDGLLVVPDEQVQQFLDRLPVRQLPGVGPASQSRLLRLGVGTVAQLRALDLADVVSLLGEAHGLMLWNLARGLDERPVVAEHATKSISVEETFETDLTDAALMHTVLARMAHQVAVRLRAAGVSGRTVTLKARYPDFTTLSRSVTRAGPTDDARTIVRAATGLLGEVDTQRGVRLLGVGCSGLTSWVQDDLFDHEVDADPAEPPAAVLTGGPSATVDPAGTPRSLPTTWRPGQDVEHAEHGRGWVWGSGAGVVTVRFEHRTSPPGPVRTFDADDPALAACQPLPLRADPPV
jgi:DNA polymerase-4